MIAALRAVAPAVLFAPALAGCVDLLGDYRTPGCDPPDCSPAPWVHTFGDPARQSLTSMAVDPFGNIFVTGAFAGTVDFGNGALQSGGSNDVFVLRLDPTGKTVWSKRFGNVGNDIGSAVAVAPDGDILVGGEFSETVDFGGEPRQSGGMLDMFVAKMSPDGDFRWSARFGGPDQQLVTSVAADGDGNVLVTGCIRGAGAFGETTWAGLLDYDAYVLALDPGGNPRWATILSSMTYNCGQRVTTDAAGNVIVAGQYSMPLVVDGATLPFGGGFDAFIVELARDTGKAIWSHGFGDPNNQYSAGVHVAKNGTIALTGSYEGTVDFGGHTLSAKAQDAFIVFLDGSGGTVRSVGISEPGNQSVLSSTLDSTGNVIVGGFSSAVQGQNQIAVAKVDMNGDLAWSQSWATIYDQYAGTVAVDPADNLLLGGDFTGTLTLGGGSVPTTGDADVFIAKLGPDSRAP